MIVLTAFASIRPGCLSAVRDHLRRVPAATLAEDGCEAYRFYVATDDDTAVVAVENWRDLDSLRTHFAAPHIAAFGEAIGPMLTAPMDVRVYDATVLDL